MPRWGSPEVYLVRERVEDGSNLFSICFAVTNERNPEVRRGFAPCEVPPFCPVEPLKDQEKQKEVWEIVNNVDGLRFDDVLSIGPGDVTEVPVGKLQRVDAPLEVEPPAHKPTSRILMT